MTNPLVETLAFLTADASNLPGGTVMTTSFPTSDIAAPHVHFAWDGTPTDADNREDTAIRVTVYTPRDHVTAAQDIAAGVRARFLDWSSPNVFRVGRGAGRLPGIDDDTELPFCTFTVYLALRAETPVLPNP